MESLNKITLTPEFTQFCDIFGFTTEEVLQEFINKVDIAQYLCYPLDPYRWANLFMMEYLIAFTESEETMVKYGQFGEKWADMMLDDRVDGYEKTRAMLDEWHKAVLEKRIQDIMGDSERFDKED